MNVDLSIIIVSWNVWSVLKANLEALEQVSRPRSLQQDTSLLSESLNNPSAQHSPSSPSATPSVPSVTSSKLSLSAQQLTMRSSALGEIEHQIRIFGPIQQNSTVAEPAIEQATLEVIVVDNASHDTTPERLPSQFPWVRFIQSEQNLGFTGGNNLGFAHARGKVIYFLNPDTEVVGDSLWTLYSALQTDSSIGVIGPRLQYADGQPQNNRRRFPTRWTGFWESTWLGQLWEKNPWTAHMFMEDQPENQRHDADWLVGAAICIDKAALLNISSPTEPGPFDEGFFMYSEELDLCKRIKEAGWRIVFEPAALVIHHEGRSSEQAVARRHINFNASKVRYYRKYFGHRWANILKRYLLFEFRVQIGLERIKLWLRHKPDLRQQRILIYQEVLASNLNTYVTS